MWRYLLGVCGSGLTALPVACLPSLAVPWAARQRERAGRLLGLPPSEGTAPAAWRAVLWSAAGLVLGPAYTLILVLLIGNAVAGGVAIAVWPHVETRLFFEILVDDWPAALTLGPLQIAVFSVAALLAARPLARGHARLCRWALGPTAAQRVTRARLDLLDAHGAELRRIERDLHDGAQARLVAIAMRLAISERVLDGVGEGDLTLVRRLVGEAHEAAESAMTELRTVIHGVYPPILADHGLAGALTDAAARCPLDVTLDVPGLDVTRGGMPGLTATSGDTPGLAVTSGDAPGPTATSGGEPGPGPDAAGAGRPVTGPGSAHAPGVVHLPAAVEAVAYFAVVEALTNAARHGNARHASVRVRHDGRTLTTTISDDGTGGADPARGTGLAGLARRAAALDGTLRVHSPAGGPTIVTVEVPCAS
ncbi:sensor histidine kinase [Catenuloplanes japonicus]|uniref:sensor histidine kinase n=1 Tax=Catenuloplanes japonicus TaxID=33876 RepID=UPI00068D0F48|nr:histidine kinase [Catenuloplanes japonicus]